ncbi:MAG: hypothetical protein CFE24_11535, partial [Flavobacterium sp. BFFFF2]
MFDKTKLFVCYLIGRLIFQAAFFLMLSSSFYNIALLNFSINDCNFTAKMKAMINRKKWLLPLVLISLLAMSYSYSQSFTATWALTSNNTPSLSGAGSTNATAGNLSGGTGLGTIGFGSNGANSNGWGTSGQDVNDYFQFTVAPTSGSSLSITSISTTNNLSSQSATAIVQYSYSSLFTSAVTVGSTFAVSSSATTTPFTPLSISVSSGQTLYVRIFCYKGTGNTITDSQTFRCKDFTISGTATPACTPPTTQPSSLTISSVSSSAANYTLTRGNGTGGVLVTARTTATSVVNPSVGSSYTPSTTYGSGTTTGTGNFTVYNGNANGVSAASGTISISSGLTAATQYTLTAYEYSSTGTCYNTSSPATVSFYTYAATPGSNPAAFSASATDQTNASLTFSAPSTISVSGYLVFQMTGSSATTFTPSNGTAYTVGTTYGDGILVANISTTSATTAAISGLAASTSYTYTLVPYNWNGANAGTYSYLNSSNRTSTISTPAITAPVINTPTSASVVNTTATLGATVASSGGSTITSRGIVWALQSANANPTLGGTGCTTVSTSGTTGAFTIPVTGITPNSAIVFVGYATNGIGTTYTSSTTINTLSVATKLVFGVSPPSTGSAGSTLTTFTVQAQRANNTIDTEYSTAVTLTLNTVSGSGSLSGTSVVPSAGVASFAASSISNTGTFTITASSGTGGSALTTVTSGQIVVTFQNTATRQWDGGTSGTGTAWMTNTNWVGDVLPASTEVAQFGATGTATGIGLNSGTNQTYAGLEITSGRTTNLSLGNSANSGGSTNTFTLRGATINSTPNVILDHNSTGNFTFQNVSSAGGSGANVFGFVMGGTSTNSIAVRNSGTVTISSIVSGTGVLSKIGSGVLFLTNSNTYSGKTVVSLGYINPATEVAFGANPASFTGDQITLDGGGIQLTTADVTINSNRGITLGATGGLLDVATSRTLTISNVITGSGTLTKTSAGTANLTAQNTYTGNTIVSAGTLQLSRSGGTSIPITNNVTITGGTFKVSSDQTMNNLTISTGGTLLIDAGITLTINGTFTYSGGTVTVNGTLAYGSSSTLAYATGASYTTASEWPSVNSPTNITLSTTNTAITLSSDRSILGNITATNSAQLIGTGRVFSVGGNWNFDSASGYTGGSNAASSVVFTSNSASSITHAGGATFRNLSFNGSANYTINNDVTISVNTLAINSGIVNMQSNTLSGSGNLTMTGGTLRLGKNTTAVSQPELSGIYALSAGTIELSGASDQKLNGTPLFNNITFSNGGTKTLSNAVTTNSAAVITIKDSAIVDAGSTTLGGTGTLLTMTDSSRLRVSGARTLPDMTGSYSLTGGTIEFYGNSNSHAVRSPLNYYAIEITGANVNGGAGNYTLASGGSFTVASGAKFSVTDQRILTAGTASVAINGTFDTADTDGFSGSNATSISPTVTLSLGANSTIQYSRIGSQTISTRTDYKNLSVINSGTKALSGDIAFSGTLTVPSTATLDAVNFIITPGSGATVTLNGIVKTANVNGFSGLSNATFASTNGFSMSISGSTIEYNGGLAQILTGRSDYNSVTVSNATGVVLNGGTTISNTLTLTSGTLTLGSHHLTIGASGTISGSFSSSNMIVATGSGEVRKTFTGTGSFTYPV